MAEAKGKESADGIGVWWLALPFGLVLIQYAEELARAGEPAFKDYLFGCISVAIGLWTGPEVIETLAEKPGSPLRRFAGTGRAIMRPILSILLLAFAARRGMQMLTGTGLAYVGLLSGYLVLVISSYFALQGWPSMLATWRGVGAMVLKLDAPKAAPGGTVTASVELNRPCRDLKAALILYSGDSKAPDCRFARYEGEVSPALERDGVWRAQASVRVPDDAPLSLEDKEGDEAWRYWDLEIVANGAAGQPVTRAETVEIEKA
jgi:hypothetical protein